MTAKCPRCDCLFETKGASEGTSIVAMLVGFVMGAAVGAVATLAFALYEAKGWPW